MPIITGQPPKPPAATQNPGQPQWHSVDAEAAGQRLDNYLLRQLKGVPKTHIYRIIRSGEVRLNKGRAAADTRLHSGDVLRLPPIRVSERMLAKGQAMAALSASVGSGAAGAAWVPARDFAVLFEDQHLLAIDKPAGVAVHGGSGVRFGVIEQLRMARPEARFLELVHRLDRETSGILLVAKKRSALTHLQQQFKARATGKTYLALVRGAWPAQRKVLDQPLIKYLLPDGERRVRVAAHGDADGVQALSLVRVLGRVDGTGWSGAAHLPDGLTLLQVSIKTGRTHQIRVHLASAGHPIAGDDKYGDFESNRRWLTLGLRRMFLHAWRLTLTHPATQAVLSLQADLPDELRALVGTPQILQQPGHSVSEP